MAVDPSVVINLAAEYTGKKAFKQADTAVGKLNSNVKKLAATFGIAFGTQALVQFSKTAVKAFAEDEAAARRLSGAVENLGIGFANPAIAKYISNLEKSAAIADDILRPAFQGLLTTTGSLTQSQKLLNDAITISRASGIDLATVTEDLGKGYIGITRGLIKYNTGLTRAELQTKSFNEILGVILARSAGAAEDYLGTTSYKMDVLSVATGNATEIIGGGFVDALARASGGTEASDAAIFLETMAGLFNKVTLAAGTSVGAIPTLAQNLKKLGKDIFFGFVGKQVGANVVSPAKKEEAKLTLTEKKQQELLAKMEKDALRREKERLALLNKQNAAKKLQGIIDKANLALLAGTNVFDMDSIQNAAALANQAQLLGNATSQAQLLQIANDVARLNVKKSILELEAAIASKDEAAIIAATAKLNADLKVLNTLGLQNIKMQDIKSILESLKPKDLINLANLNAAIALLQQLLGMQSGTGTGTGTTTGTTTFFPDNPFAGQPVIAPLTGNESMDAILEYSDAVTALANAMADTLDSQSYSDYLSLVALQAQLGDLGGYSPGMNRMGGSVAGADSGSGITVNITTGIGDPNAIAEAVDQVLQDAVDRGTLRVR
jgi:hypothetical protein